MKGKNKDKNLSRYIEAHHYKLNIKWVLSIFVVVLILSFFYITYIKDLTYHNIYNNITELSEQTAAQLNLAITDHKKFVEIMVDSIGHGYFKTPQEIFERFEGDLEDYNITRLVILDKNGNGTTSDGHIVQNYANIQEFFNSTDDVYLSENRPSTVSNNQVNIYSKVFRLNGEELVLFATINTEDYKEILLRRLFNGKGGTYLINNNGSILIDSFDEIKENNVNFFDYMKEHYLTHEEDVNKFDVMAQNIKNLQVGTFDVKLDRSTHFIHYEKVNVNDWYVVTLAPDTTIAKELLMFLSISFGVCFLINLTVIGTTIYIDIENQKKNHNLYQVAYIDPVTRLGNETYFRENGSNYLKNGFKNAYILTFDINKFKALNNIYGYEFCNEILKALGEKLLEHLPSDNITCRISNDVFATIFSYEKKIETLLDKLYKHASILKINNIDVPINLSMGVYRLKQNDTDINKLLDKSFMARSKIKGLYDTYYYIFDDVLEHKLMEEQQIEACMESALKNKEFKIVYQPKIRANNDKLVGAEALVRWYKDGEMIPPDKFIPLFEKNKFIRKLDLYIFEQVCQDLATWRKNYDFVPTVSINVSKENFVNEHFIDEYVKICKKYGLEPNSIDLEITESATAEQGTDILSILNTIKKKGFVISIDDFGTGYSSLSMLQNMPIDIIKIDKVFVDKANLNSNDNIINYIAFLAKQLGVKTIVEGVETKEQLDYVKNLNCNIVQGYYYSKPLSKPDFEDYMEHHK